MAQDIFLKLTGIDGESGDSNYKNAIDILQWDWKITQTSNMHSGSGGGSGRSTVYDLNFEHYVDRASPHLMKYCLTGKHIPEAVMINRKAGGNPLEYMKITMNDVIVTLVHPVSSRNDGRIREQVSLSFARVQQEYVLQNAQGGRAGAVLAGYDMKANREV